MIHESLNLFIDTEVKKGRRKIWWLLNAAFISSNYVTMTLDYLAIATRVNVGDVGQMMLGPATIVTEIFCSGR
jgi:hypothetical protein